MHLRKTKQRMGAATLAMMLAVPAMTGCTQRETDDIATIDWYMMKLVDNTSSQELVEEAVNRVLEKELGARISLHFIEKGNYYEKMNTIISAGESFDICFQSDVTKFLNNVKNGAFVKLDDMLEEYAPDILEKNSMWEASSVDGSIYGVKSQGAYSKEVGTVFKKDLVEKYEFDYKSVHSIAELEPYLEIIKKNEPSVTPLLPTVTEVSNRYTDDSIKGLVYDEDAGEYVKLYNVDFYIDRYKTLSDYYQKGYIAKDAITKTETTVEARSGNYAVMGDSGFYTEDGSKSTAQYGFPCVDSYMGQTTINPKGGAMNCISTTSKHPELALQVLNLIWKDPELSNTLAYGIEGVNYSINEERTAELGEKSVIPASGSDSTWTIYHNYIGPLFDQWDSAWNTKESLEKMQDMNKTGKVSGTLGFMFDSEPVKTEYAKVTSILSECEPVFRNGCMDDFDIYYTDVMKRLDGAGIDVILNEANKQLKEWRNITD